MGWQLATSIAFALPMLALALPATAAAGVSIADEVTFATAGQPLFAADENGGAARKVIPFGSTPLVRDRRGPVTAGAIYRLDQPIPVETAQAIWARALDACMTSRSRVQTISVTLPIVGTVSRSCRGTVTPSAADCIAGGTIRPPLSATCCLYGGTFPNCTDGIGPDTVSVGTDRISFDVGAGIGPRPTSGTTRPYDIGVIATVQTDVEIGLEGQLVLDGGSVDVVYPTAIHLETSAERVAPGEVFAIRGTHVPAAPSLTTAYPHVSLALYTYAAIDAGADVEYAGIDYATGAQLRGTRAVHVFRTADDPQADDAGRILTPVFAVKAGLGAGLQVSVNTDIGVGGVAAQLLDPIGPFVLPLAFPFDVTLPPKPAPFCEVLPRPDCSFNPPVSTDIVELLFRTPLLDTPAVPDFNGGSDFTGVAGPDVPVAQARNQLLADGAVRNTTITGKRDALQSSLEAVGGDLRKLGLDDGLVDTDLVRLGVDIDGSLIGFGLPPGGGQLELPPQLPAGFPIAKLAGKRLLEVEANLVDLDAVDFLYFDQEIVFRPNLVVELVFDRPVQVRRAGTGGFTPLAADAHGEYVAALPITPAGLTAIEVRQPPGGVTITPRYSLAANEFQNNLDWLINAGIQGTVGQLTIGGYVAAIIAPILSGLSDVETLDFALGQFAPTFDEPLRLPAHEAFALAGFGAPIPGTAFVIHAADDCRGDCDGDGVVSIAELIGGIASALGGPTPCAALDRDGDGRATIGELIAAVDAALSGCPAAR